MEERRLQVFSRENGFEVKRFNLGIDDSVQILRTVQTHLHLLRFGVPCLTVKEAIDDYKFFPVVEGEERKVCIAFNEETQQIQYAVTGLSVWETQRVLQAAEAYLLHVLLFGERTYADHTQSV